MLPFTSPKEALLAFPSSPSWNLSFFTVESTPPSPCSHSDLPLTRQGAALAHLDSLHPHDVVFWTDGSVPFFLAKAALAYLPSALSVAPRSLFPSQQAQYAQVSLLKPAPFCMLFAGLGNTNKSAISLLFSTYLILFCPHLPVLSSIFPSDTNSLEDLAGTVFFVLLFYQTTMGPRTLVSPEE